MKKAAGASRSQHVDPGVLEIVGAVSQVLGLAEHAQRILPLRRLRVQRRHARIEKQLDSFSRRLEDARAAIRVLRSAIGESMQTPTPGVIAFAIPASELPVFRRGIEGLQLAIRGMTVAAYDLESLTAASATDMERFYRVSSSGAPVLSLIAELLARVAADKALVSIAGRPANVPLVLVKVDEYLAHVSALLSERDKWLTGRQ
jgi:hypothetical protein